MMPSRSAAMAATWGTPPEATASSSTLSMADGSMLAMGPPVVAGPSMLVTTDPAGHRRRDPVRAVTPATCRVRVAPWANRLVRRARPALDWVHAARARPADPLRLGGRGRAAAPDDRRVLRPRRGRRAAHRVLPRRRL